MARSCIDASIFSERTDECTVCVGGSPADESDVPNDIGEAPASAKASASSEAGADASGSDGDAVAPGAGGGGEGGEGMPGSVIVDAFDCTSAGPAAAAAPTSSPLEGDGDAAAFRLPKKAESFCDIAAASSFSDLRPERGRAPPCAPRPRPRPGCPGADIPSRSDGLQPTRWRRIPSVKVKVELKNVQVYLNKYWI